MEEINLEEILTKWVSYNLQQLGKSKEASDAVAKTSIKGGGYWYILEAMKEACKQVLELAAENAEEEFSDIQEWSEFHQKYINPICGVDKNSILKTINQVK